MGKPSAPTPADPKVTAGAQTAQNIGTAIAQQQLNNTNQVTPYGNLSYEQTGSYQYTDPNSGETYDIPKYTATQSLSKGQQQILRENERAQKNLAALGANQSGRLDNLLSRPMDLSGSPERGDPSSIQGPNLGRVGNGPRLQTNVGDAGSVQRNIQGQIAGAGRIQDQIGNAGQITRSYGGDFSADRQRVENALMSRLNPGLQKDRAALEARLASQGIRVGSEAYQSAMDDFGRQSNDARMSAILNAGQEQSRLTNLKAQRAGFENSAQQQAFNQHAQRAGFSNQAQAQQFGQNAQQTKVGNQAQNQVFQQMLAQAGFGNQARQQMYQNQAGATQANNQAELQGFNADLTRFNAQNSARQSALQEVFARRNQPINEITALMSGAQVRNPNFVNTTPAQLANTDFAGIQANYDNAMQQRYQNRMSGWNQFWGGLGGLGGAYIGTLK